MELTTCEAMVYEAMKKERRKMTAVEVTELTNQTFCKKWPQRAVKAFLKRLVEKGCVEKTKTGIKTFYAWKGSSKPMENCPKIKVEQNS